MRTPLGTVPGLSWRRKGIVASFCAAKGALDYAAQVEKNRQEHEIEKANLDIMNRAQTFKGKARASKEKGTKKEVNFIKMQDIIVVGSDGPPKNLNSKQKCQTSS